MKLHIWKVIAYYERYIVARIQRKCLILKSVDSKKKKFNENLDIV